jgi:transcription elongation factor Elf1
VANFTDESMSEEFACPVCDSPAIVYPEEGEEDRIVCGGCGAFVATRDQFRRLVERHAEVQTSGC